MNMVDGGQSAIFLGYSSTNGSMIFKLFCDSNDAGQWKSPMENNSSISGTIGILQRNLS